MVKITQSCPNDPNWYKVAQNVSLINLNFEFELMIQTDLLI